MSKRNHIIGASPSVYDKFHRSAEDELITETIVWTFPGDKSRRYHVPPFKLVESDGENLWYRWWQGNEKLKAHAIDVGQAKASPESDDGLTLIEKPFDLDRGTRGRRDGGFFQCRVAGTGNGLGARGHGHLVRRQEPRAGEADRWLPGSRYRWKPGVQLAAHGRRPGPRGLAGTGFWAGPSGRPDSSPPAANR